MHAQRVILVTGPESTGTRVLANALISLLGGPAKLDDHFSDMLGDVWLQLNAGISPLDLLVAKKDDVLITRRSIPCAMKEKGPAQYMVFPPFEAFYSLLEQAHFDVLTLITVRDPMAALKSAARNRVSCKRDLFKARNQYEAGLRHLMQAVLSHPSPFLFVPLEALALGKAEFLYSLLEGMALHPQKPANAVEDAIRTSVNDAYHCVPLPKGFNLFGKAMPPDSQG